MSCTPFVPRVLLTPASSPGSCVSLSLFWLSLGVARDLGQVVSFASSLGIPLKSMGLFNTARNVYYLFWLKPDKIFKMIFFKEVLWLEVGQIES